MNPRGSLHGPDALRVLLLKLLGQFNERRVIVRRFVVTHAFPVKRLGCGFRVAVMLEHVRISALRLSPVFAHERNARQTQLQLSAKLNNRQIAFDAITFNAIWIEYERGWRPHGVEAMKVSGMLFDVCRERHEVVVDEGGGFVVIV